MLSVSVRVGRSHAIVKVSAGRLAVVPVSADAAGVAEHTVTVDAPVVGVAVYGDDVAAAVAEN